jgi:hypothetical protein
VITIALSEDVEYERRRLNWLRELLRSYPGSDRVEIRLFYPDGRRHRLRLPEATCYHGELRKLLSDHFGAHNIKVTPLPPQETARQPNGAAERAEQRQAQH